MKTTLFTDPYFWVIAGFIVACGVLTYKVIKMGIEEELFSNSEIEIENDNIKA